jgi:protein O-GlcNAc transferase
MATGEQVAVATRPETFHVEANVEAVLNAAVAEYRAGNLGEAERLYRELLAAQPDQADAHHNLGVLATQTGHPAEALGHFQAALEADPRQPRFWLSGIEALIRLGQIDTAAEMLMQARRCGLQGVAADALSARLRAISQNGQAAGKNWMPDLAGASYLHVLERLHGVLLPQTYLEIGVETGANLALARCPSIGIDPRFQFREIGLVQRIVAKPSLLLYQMPSDEFFASRDSTELLGAPIGFAFLDGMHRCEYLLRDFQNVEKHCRPDSVIALHDCLPLELSMAEREPGAAPIEPRRQGMWTGDVWRTALLLQRRRPDLRMLVLDAAPTGLVLITNLDPGNRLVEERHDSLVAEMMSWSLETITLAGYYAEIGVEAEALLRRPEELVGRLRGGSPPELASASDPAAARGAGRALVAHPIEAIVAAPLAESPSPAHFSEGPLTPKKKRKRGQRARDRLAAIARAGASPSKPVELGDTADLMGSLSEGRYVEAEAIARALIQRFPEQGYGWKALGVALHRQDRFEEAVEAKRRSAELLPADAEAHNNLGNSLLKLKGLGEGESAYRAALELRPEYPEALSGLGISRHQVGRLEEAEALCRRALELRPDFADAHSNLGLTLQSAGRPGEAEACYRRALLSEPGHFEAWNNLGITLQKLNRLGEAEAAHRKAIELKPGYADAFTNLAGCLQQQARPAEAEACYRRAIELDPGQMNAYSNLLFTMSHNLSTTAEALFAEHLRVGARFEAGLCAGRQPHANSRDPERRLEVGFVSGDFRLHAMSHYLEPALEHLARQPSLRLHAYASHFLDDEVTERLRGHVPRWNRIVGLSDEAFAERIRADGIDILVDLSGYTGGHRISAFAHKPAPVQCGWIGYLGSSGMECMDYYLADRFYLPRDQFEQFFTENIVHLPVSAPFQPSAAAPEVAPLPALANGHITFGSFSRMGKLGPEAIALWPELLRALPGSRMLLGAMAGKTECATMVGWFAAAGIAPDRLHFHFIDTMEGYLQRHAQVDLCLDPFPFTGATTTCHAMWMGVPTLTLEGNTAPGRLGAAMLRHVGLEDFVAGTREEFVAKGLHLAREVEALAELRRGLRERFQQSPLGRPADFAVDLARAFRGMWRSWCERPGAGV